MDVIRLTLMYPGWATIDLACNYEKNIYSQGCGNRFSQDGLPC